VTTQYDRAWPPAEPRGTQLVVIGLRGLDRDKIVRMLNG
jgi:cobalamin biosynthesis protein CobW